MATSDQSPNSPALRVGILGAARIAPGALIEPARATGAFEVVRIAARDTDRAAAFASEHDIAHVSANYDELINADDIDVVYNPLPMSLHAQWTIAALQAGKHVLCEKPFASNADEAAAMVAASDDTGMVLGEAFHYWYHPMFQRVLSLVNDGVIGTVERLDADFAIRIAKPDLRWSWDTSGGSTMDLGCYPIHWVRSVMGSEPTVESAVCEQAPEQIDASLTAQLSFDGGATARVHSAMNCDDPVVRLEIVGSAGRIVATNPLSPQNGNTLTVETSGGVTTGMVHGGNTYEHMCRAFADHVSHAAPYPTKAADAVANMATIDACYIAAGLPRRGT